MNTATKTVIIVLALIGVFLLILFGATVIRVIIDLLTGRKRQAVVITAGGRLPPGYYTFQSNSTGQYWIGGWREQATSTTPVTFYYDAHGRLSRRDCDGKVTEPAWIARGPYGLAFSNNESDALVWDIWNRGDASGTLVDIRVTRPQSLYLYAAPPYDWEVTSSTNTAWRVSKPCQGSAQTEP